ncbi:TetR/AcrR family transcriptional regulator [Actinoplanes sp. LDG1-06]|uniref:TetR/AcrR family transcriptional regulator n=1 Tax=Paractinoplanes ovalisporus TaxID=2810368 RepID=A0ABS2AP60_9ACTN|nr:TetR/AcrR family transcriptional regulator [Actinoplanes ovalisporus]MBM2621036.1 TetR/AcrR family transcriptional regulator [Actinoplanes ovalisporus]
MTARAPRADALRNRSRVLAAAEQVFVARGTSVSTEEVARSAGVGIGTVFRHFPTKAALIEAVFRERLRRFGEEADQLVASDDPAAAIWTFLSRVAEVAAGKQAWADAFTSANLHDVLTPAREQLPRVLGALLARAQQVGAIRADVTVPELIALMLAVARVPDETPEGTALRARVLAIVFDGLRPRP